MHIDIQNPDEWHYDDTIDAMICSPIPEIHYIFYADEKSYARLEKRREGDVAPVNFFHDDLKLPFSCAAYVAMCDFEARSRSIKDNKILFLVKFAISYVKGIIANARGVTL
jgi:hypothetical protein